MKTRVYVVDDDEQMRLVLTRILQSDYDVMCFAAAQHFLDVAAALVPGCLILDVHMPGISGLGVLRSLAEARLHFPTIVITGLGDVSTAVQAMKAGAMDFIEKPFRNTALLASIRLAQQQLPGAAGAKHEDVGRAKARIAMLSPRELQVLDGLVAGLPNKTIAYDLGISPRTVEMHRAHLMAKMEVHSLSALVRAALASGIAVR